MTDLFNNVIIEPDLQGYLDSIRTFFEIECSLEVSQIAEFNLALTIADSTYLCNTYTQAEQIALAVLQAMRLRIEHANQQPTKLGKNHE